MATTDQAVQEITTIGEDQVKDSLEHIGKALSASDFESVSKYWEVPALVLSDEGSIPVSSAEEIEKFFAKAAKWYHSQGLVSTRPEIERFEALSPRLASVDVRWPSFDKDGAEKSSERSFYLLRLGDDGVPRIKAALTRTETS